jgi:hypothetical protein
VAALAPKKERRFMVIVALLSADGADAIPVVVQLD